MSAYSFSTRPLYLASVRLVVGVLRVAADRREAAAHRLLVDRHLAGVARHEDAHLALVDAREQALVDELAARLLAALEVLAGEGRRPRARALRVRAADAELMNSATVWYSTWLSFISMSLT